MISARQSVYDESVVSFDGLTQYLSEITTYPMKEYLLEVDRHPVLTEEEEQRLAEQVYTSGDEGALVKLVLSNLRLAARIALTCCDGPRVDPADDVIMALYRWSAGSTAAPKMLTFRLALPTVAGG